MFEQPKSESARQRQFSRCAQGFSLSVNVKKFIILAGLAAMTLTSVVACGGETTPTRTRVAQVESTQTPWIIYYPVTTTPPPATITLVPTNAVSAPVATEVPPTKPPAPQNTRPTQPAVSPQPTAPPEPPTAEPPTATSAPSCGQAYQVTNLTFPENGAKREAKAGSGAGKTIQFKWDPIASYEMDPKIGYRINISTPRNSQSLYISHNAYLKEQVAILSQQATYGLTQGDDATASWFVEVIMASGEFNDAGDDTQPPLGTITVCGPQSPTFTIELSVQ